MRNRLYFSGAGLVFVGALVGLVLYMGTGGGSTSRAEALQDDGWREQFHEKLDRLQPGMGYLEVTETYTRHGAGANLIRERSEPYTPETFEMHFAIGSDDSGAVENFRMQIMDVDGGILAETVKVGDTIIGRDYRPNALDATEEDEFPAGLAQVDGMRQSLLVRQEAAIQDYFDVPSDDVEVFGRGDTWVVRYASRAPSVSPGEGSFTIPYVADLEIDRVYREVEFDKETYWLIGTRVVAVLADGSDELLESWRVLKADIASSEELF
jgi:hypothetical protein